MENENNFGNAPFDRQRFGESLEKFEIAKLRRKYEAYGYEFKEEISSQNFQIDAYAINRKTGDEVIFEIKSIYTYNKHTAQDIKRKREEYHKLYPKARFILVLAREEKPLGFQFPQLADLLYQYIFHNSEMLDPPYSRNFWEIRYHDVSDLECTDFTYIENGQIQLKGFANFRFWMDVNEKDFKGQILNDGIPFAYTAMVKFTQEGIYLTDCKIEFDFSEFELPNES